jgi:hypothetical protein
MRIRQIFSLGVTVTNIIYTEPGILQGFTIKQIRIFGPIGKSWVSFSIPFWILSYNKKNAQDLQKSIDALNKARKNGEI